MDKHKTHLHRFPAIQRLLPIEKTNEHVALQNLIKQMSHSNLHKQTKKVAIIKVEKICS